MTKAQSRDLTSIKVREVVADLCAKPFVEVTEDKRLAEDLDLDSLDRFELTIDIEDAFGIIVEDGIAAPLGTVGELVDLVHGMVTL